MEKSKRGRPKGRKDSKPRKRKNGTLVRFRQPLPPPIEAPRITMEPVMENQNSSGTTVPFSENQPPAVDPELAAASARIVDAVAPDQVEPPNGEPATAAERTYTLGMCGEITVSQDSVRGVLPHIFDAIATIAKNPALKLEEYELDLGAPAVTGCINRYLPDWLKKTDSPELAMLLIFATAYGFRVGAGPLIEKIMGKFSPADRDTETRDSKESSASSEHQAPEKPFGSPATSLAHVE